MKPVTARAVRARNAKHLARNHIPAVHHHDPVHRSHEFGVAVSPAHAFGYRQSCERLVDDLRYQLSERQTLFRRPEHQPGALVRLLLFELIDSNATGTRKALRSPGRPAVRIVRSLQARALALDAAVRLSPGHISDQHSQATRRGKTPDIADCEPGVCEAVSDAPGQRIGQSPQCPWRQLLGADFDQQLPAHAAPCLAGPQIGNPSASRES